MWVLVTSWRKHSLGLLKLNSGMGTIDLVLNGVDAAYEADKPVLRGVSMQVSEGEVVALIGTSGCGKSTLLLLVGGFLPPTGGELVYRGQSVSGPDAQRILLTQTDSTWPWKTALENVAYPLRCQGRGRGEARSVAARWLEAVGLGDSGRVLPAALSGGMRQRVGLAKVFALRPRLLLLDEPFGALDEITRHTLNQVFLKLWRENRMSVVFVTHSLDEALYLSDRLVVLGGKPASVVGDFRNPLPRPDRVEDTFCPEADALRVKVLRLLAEATQEAAGVTAYAKADRFRRG